MKQKASLVFFTVLVLALTLCAVTASTCSATDGFATIDRVYVDDIEVNSNTAAGFVDNEVNVDVYFTANDDVSDVRVKVYIEGYKDEVSETSDRFRIVENSKYKKTFSIKLPSTFDLDEDPEDLVIRVRVYAKNEEPVECEGDIKMQRNLYSLNILSVESDNEVSAGDVLGFDVVVENNGYERLNNVYLRVSIPDLGIERKAFIGDLSAIEVDDVNEDNDDQADTVNKRIYIDLPRNAESGIYDVKVEAYNYDTIVSTSKKVAIQSVEAGIIPSVTSKSVSVGEETEFELVLVNPNDRMVVYSITPSDSKGLIVNINEPIVTVPADSSRTVKVRVKATESTEEGTHLISVNVNSESGLVRQVAFSVNVEESSQTTDTIFVLTVVLAIVFIVLLIILIVLLTKKPEETEEFGETSYY